MESLSGYNFLVSFSVPFLLTIFGTLYQFRPDPSPNFRNQDRETKSI